MWLSSSQQFKMNSNSRIFSFFSSFICIFSHHVLQNKQDIIGTTGISSYLHFACVSCVQVGSFRLTRLSSPEIIVQKEKKAQHSRCWIEFLLRLSSILCKFGFLSCVQFYFMLLSCWNWIGSAEVIADIDIKID